MQTGSGERERCMLGQGCRIVVLAVAGCLWLSNNSHAQSFNCRYARASSEVAICKDAKLSSLDSEMSDLFFKLPEWRKQEIGKEQDRWLAQRNKCGSNSDCLSESYVDRISRLQDYLLESSPEAERVYGNRSGCAREAELWDQVSDDAVTLRSDAVVSYESECTLPPDVSYSGRPMAVDCAGEGTEWMK